MKTAHNNLNITEQKNKELERTISSQVKSLQQNPDQPQLHNKLGTIFHYQGNLEKAIYHWDKALELKPDLPDVLNNLAWVLATVEDMNLQNHTKAVRLSQRACELTGYERPGFLDTLAVAYAAVGRFAEAVETTENAIELALVTGRKELTTQLQQRLQLYQHRQTYYESAWLEQKNNSNE